MNYKKLWYLLLCIPLHSVIQTAQSSMPRTQSKKDELLIQAIENNETKETIRLLKLGADPNAIKTEDAPPSRNILPSTPIKETVLCLAAKKGNSVILQALLDHKADPRKRTENTTSELPLHQAVRSGHLECVKILVNAAPDTLEERMSVMCHATPLWTAIIEKHTEVAQFLLNKGANPHSDPTAKNRITLLHIAAGQANPTLVKEFLDRGLNPNDQRSYRGQTPLHLAASNKALGEVAKLQKECTLKLLLARGASLESKDWNGETPVDEEKDSKSSTFLQEYAACHPTINKTEEHPLFRRAKQAYDEWMLKDQPVMLAAMLGLVPDHPMNTDSYAVEITRKFFDPKIFDTMTAKLLNTPTVATFVQEEQTRNQLREEESTEIDSIKTKMHQELKEQQSADVTLIK